MLSDLFFVDASMSRMRDAHIKHVGEPFAPSTLEKYLHIWDIWHDHLASLQLNPFQPTSTAMADFLHVHSKGSLGSAVHGWKGLKVGLADLQVGIISWDVIIHPLSSLTPKGSIQCSDVRVFLSC